MTHRREMIPDKEVSCNRRKERQSFGNIYVRSDEPLMSLPGLEYYL